ncbi:hypothetical protein HXX76_015588 [Chlamydomonas incerta]|uniref:EF-hand domain-containing protein n=1 Tax=Chlamydomonas incerta TaxID=51695 RepID=A0A835VN86_CHLIN|nr:hypothetical protein HXX76_015588 [Chlamydomonas incerta]|eukprot:KAG2423072.1 hypothetical protein HXX76_015588 [Chlamydomonas incerta]
MRLTEGGKERPEMAEDSIGAEMALCRLAETLVQPGNTAAAASAFQQYDTSGDGYLDVGELCKALRSLPGVQLSGHEVRLLLAYLFHYGDKDKDLRLSVAELQSSLAPFVPRPKEEELQRAVSAYNANHNLPALLRNIHKLQPALLPAACTQLSVAEAASPFQLESLGALVTAAAPGVAVPPIEVEQLRQLLVLDTGATAMLPSDLVTQIGLCADAYKRAAAISRMVSEAKSQNVPVQLDTDLGGAEIVLQRLSDILVEGQGQQISEAFKHFDKDGSGYLDGPEFCGALRQVQAMITVDEVRTMLAYIQTDADKDVNGRISLEEVQAILQPFQ